MQSRMHEAATAPPSSSIYFYKAQHSMFKTIINQTLIQITARMKLSSVCFISVALAKVRLFEFRLDLKLSQKRSQTIVLNALSRNVQRDQLMSRSDLNGCYRVSSKWLIGICSQRNCSTMDVGVKSTVKITIKKSLERLLVSF